MDKEEILKLRAHLRRSFGAPTLGVAPSSKERDAADVALGERKIGTITVDDEDGDRSFSFEMKIPVERPVIQDYLRRLFENDKLTRRRTPEEDGFGRTQQRRRFPRHRFRRRSRRQDLHAANGDPRFRSRGFVSGGRAAPSTPRRLDQAARARLELGPLGEQRRGKAHLDVEVAEPEIVDAGVRRLALGVGTPAAGGEFAPLGRDVIEFVAFERAAVYERARDQPARMAPGILVKEALVELGGPLGRIEARIGRLWR